MSIPLGQFRGCAFNCRMFCPQASVFPYTTYSSQPAVGLLLTSNMATVGAPPAPTKKPKPCKPTVDPNGCGYCLQEFNDVRVIVLPGHYCCTPCDRVLALEGSLARKLLRINNKSHRTTPTVDTSSKLAEHVAHQLEWLDSF